MFGKGSRVAGCKEKRPRKKGKGGGGIHAERERERNVSISCFMLLSYLSVFMELHVLGSC